MLSAYLLVVTLVMIGFALGVCMIAGSVIYHKLILMPIHMKCRFRLFALRDKLRMIKIMNPEFDVDDFANIQSSINAGINAVDRINLRIYNMIFREDKEFREYAEKAMKKRLRILNKYPTLPLREIDDEIGKIVANAMKWNSLAYLFYCFNAKKFKGAWNSLNVASKYFSRFGEKRSETIYPKNRNSGMSYFRILSNAKRYLHI